MDGYSLFNLMMNIIYLINDVKKVCIKAAPRLIKDLEGVGVEINKRHCYLRRREIVLEIIQYKTSFIKINISIGFLNLRLVAC